MSGQAFALIGVLLIGAAGAPGAAAQANAQSRPSLSLTDHQSAVCEQSSPGISLPRAASPPAVQIGSVLTLHAAGYPGTAPPEDWAVLILRVYPDTDLTRPIFRRMESRQDGAVQDPVEQLDQALLDPVAELTRRFFRRTLHRFDKQGTTTLLVDADDGDKYIFSLRRNVPPAATSLGDAADFKERSFGDSVCYIEATATNKAPQGAFGARFQTGLRWFVWDLRHDTEPPSNWGLREIQEHVYLRGGRFEFGGGVGQIFTGKQFEGSVNLLAHGAWSKGDYGLQFSFGDVFNAGFKAPALGAETEIQTPPIYHRPFWLTFQYRHSLTSNDPAFPSWAFRFGFRYDAIPNTHVR